MTTKAIIRRHVEREDEIKRLGESHMFPSLGSPQHDRLELLERIAALEAQIAEDNERIAELLRRFSEIKETP